jgi:FlaA1/EpsC-like NDP-sugar epimerase
LYEAHRELSQLSPVTATPVLGTVCDAGCLRDVMSRYRPEVIYHAAAYKHVPLAEANPFAVLQNNAVGTATLAATAAAFNVPQVIMVSTDKAVAPAGIMGASKRIGELAVFRHSHGGSMSAVRLGNVFGSPGSVAPLFQTQIYRGGPLTLTRPGARRYFLTIGEVTEYLSAALGAPRSCELLVPDMGDSLCVADLARFMIGDRDIPIRFDGLRPGDKMEESLLAPDESYRERLQGGLNAVASPRPSAQAFDDALMAMQQAIDLRDLDMLLTTVRHLVPGYTPSTLLLEQLSADAEALR